MDYSQGDGWSVEDKDGVRDKAIAQTTPPGVYNTRGTSCRSPFVDKSVQLVGSTGGEWLLQGAKGDLL